VPGLAEQFKGKAPDCGAYEFSDEPWKPGHDFAKPPNPAYALTPCPLRNRVKNGGFELFRAAQLPETDQLPAWRATHAKAARLVQGRGGIQEHIDTRDSYLGHAVCLGGTTDDSIEQDVAGLEPDTKYTLAAWLKLDDAQTVRLGIKDYGRNEIYKTARLKKWQHIELDFTTGPAATTATLYLLKPGRGKAFADEIGLVPALTPTPPAKK